MRVHCTYLAETVIEVVIDGEEVAVNILPVESSQLGPPVSELSPLGLDPTETPPAEASLEPQEPECGPLVLSTAAEPSKSSRGLPAVIRGMWTFLIAMFVEGGTYLVNNLTSLNIPPGVGLASGALLQGAIYGAKKYVKPDGLL